MAQRRDPKVAPHEEAVSILEKLIRENLGGEVKATAECNQCPENLTINLVAGAEIVERNRTVGTVRPDLALTDTEGNPVRFIEIVDSHAPEGNLHEYALRHGVEVVEFHLRARGEFTGRRRNRALDESLRVKARLEAMAEGRLEIDAHNILCKRPKCVECGTGLPLRKIAVRITDCWNCGQNVNVAIGDIDGSSLEQDDFTAEEREFARSNGVTLERRFSATARAMYLANVCTNCDQIQGNWFLYMDPFHDRFNLHQIEREAFGPCDRCSSKYCLTHGEYMDYDGNRQCPECLRESERVVCPNQPNRDCFYPHRCEENGCYFVNRAEQQREELRRYEEQLRIEQEKRQRERESRSGGEAKTNQPDEWAELQEWFNQRLRDQDEDAEREDEAKLESEGDL